MRIIFWPTITCWFFSIQIKSLKFYQLLSECEKVVLDKKWNYDPLSMNACTKNTCGRNLIRCKSKTLSYRLNFLWVSLVDVRFLIFQNHTKYQTISHNLIFFPFFLLLEMHSKRLPLFSIHRSMKWFKWAICSNICSLMVSSNP